MNTGSDEGFITTGDGCRLHWRAEGSADQPVLILSNSLGTTLEMWAPQTERLSRHFRLIRYDTRGHGRSDAPAGSYSLDRLGRDVIELADGLGIERFAFCGLSLGGMTGQWLGVRAPERLTRLVIANSSPFMGPPSGWDSRIRTVRSEGMEAIADAVIERWFTPAFSAIPVNLAAIRTALLRIDPAGYAGACAAVRDMDMRPVLSLITTPTLIIGGDADPATPSDHTLSLAENIPEARHVFLKAAHLSNIEQPEAFTEALLSHLG